LSLTYNVDTVQRHQRGFQVFPPFCSPHNPFIVDLTLGPIAVNLMNWIYSYIMVIKQISCIDV